MIKHSTGLFPLVPIITILLSAQMVVGQTEEEKQQQSPDYFDARGYVKNLNILNYTKVTDLVQDNFIHNRINLRAYPSKRFTAGLEFRNRFFYGETVKLDPTYESRIDQDPGFFDMSFLWASENAYLGHTMIDRAWFNYADDNWDIRLGRQRINWGISLVWNPNDLFNTYSFVDFDYEERPGSDALRVQHYFSGMSSVELAVKPDTGKDASVIAGMYRFNKWNYDFQVLGGVYYADAALGLGWAGNLGNAGLKGEATYFHPKTKLDTTGVLNATAGVDYSFRSGLYINGSVLYNQNGINDPTLLNNPNLFATGTISAKNLMPSEWSLFGQANYPFNPLLSGSFATIYAPGINLVFVMPNLTYSVATNWELLLLGQFYYAEIGGPFGFRGSGIFFRTKFSF